MAAESLTDFVEIVMGQSPPGDKVSHDTGVPLLNGPTEFGFHHPTPIQFTVDARKIAQPGDLLFCVRGSTTGRMNWAEQKYAIGRGVAAIRHRWAPKLQPFVRAVIEFELPDLLAQATGSTFPNVSASQLAAIPYPSLSTVEQHAIAHILGTLDDKIELNRRMNETLEAMARALFKDWFVDFGPTRRKIEGATDPVAILGGLAPNPEKAATIAALFPATIAENGMPDGWASRPIGEALSDTIGGDWGKEEADSQNDQAVAIIRGTDFPDLKLGGVAKAPTRFTTQKKLERRKLEGFDILIEVSGGSPTQPTGRSMIVTDSILHRFNTPVVCASFCRRFRPVDRKTAAFLYQHLTTLYESGDTWEYQNQSTGISNFQTTHFLKTEHIVDPGSPALEAYSEIVMPMILRANSNENLELARARDLVLPKLISGEIRLRDVDGAIGNTLSFHL